MVAVSVILGAGGGIGSACCRAFAKIGRRVLAADIRAQSAAEAISRLPHDPLARGVDVAESRSVVALAEEAAKLGQVTDMVYAPGLVMTAAIEETDWMAYRRLMSVNLDGAFHAAAAFVRVMKQQANGGAIVLIASIAGRRGEAGASHYCASKFALIGLAESLAAELAGDRIRVNAVCPGNVATPMLAEAVRQIAGYRKVSESEIWSGMRNAGAASRLIESDEIAAACAAICGPAFSAMTGATLTLDAGAMVG
jgi:NAD(P)-dependent dehydrogenase (short-subunit alcohol dehydrogenase family)